jgi:hypothetical protein
VKAYPKTERRYGDRQRFSGGESVLGYVGS